MKRFFNPSQDEINYKKVEKIIRENIKDGETLVLIERPITELSDEVISKLPTHTFYEISGTSSDAVLTSVEIKNNMIVIHGQISDSPLYMVGEEVAFGIEDIQIETHITLFESLSNIKGLVIPRDLDLISRVLVYIDTKIYLVNRSFEVRAMDDKLFGDDEITLFELMDISTEMETGVSSSIFVSDYSEFETVNMADRERVETFLNRDGC